MHVVFPEGKTCFGVAVVMSIYEAEATRQTTEQVLLEIVRIKLSSGLNVNKVDRKLILGYVEAHYGRAKKYRTKENKLYGG